MVKEHPQLRAGHFCGKYKVTKHIGSGGFGEIYHVEEKEEKKNYAMKIEYLRTQRTSLDVEIEILKKLSDSTFFPKLVDDGQTSNIRYYVMELLGPSLQVMKHANPKKAFTMLTVLKIGYSSLLAIEDFHKRGFIHRDIKPGNFLIRNKGEYPIVLIDFGLCRCYRDKDGKHLPAREDPGFTGTCRYASVNAHKYNELSRRDDLISWIYTLVELADGKLPWPGTKNREQTQEMKNTISASVLLHSFTDEILDIYRSIRALKYDEDPNYDLYKKNLLIAIKDEEKNTKKNDYDWFYWSKEKLDEISPITFCGENHKSLSESLESTKAVVGPPAKPFNPPNQIYNQNIKVVRKVAPKAPPNMEPESPPKNDFFNCCLL